MVRIASRKFRPSRPAYRPLVERLEDRLPPGDAVLAGMLAQGILPERATGFSPVVPAATPRQARRLAEAAPFDLAADLELRTDVSESVRDAQVRGHAATVPGPLTELEVLTGEPVALRKAPVGHAATFIDPHSGSDFPRPFVVLEAPAGAPGRGDLGALTQPRSPLTPTDYQLDQAVAALTLPAEDEGTRGTPVRALFNLGHPSTGPFPSNWFTVFDDTQNTWRRVNLPYPDCSVYVSDCEDIAVLNELDGFNLQPRLSIPFSGPIDASTVSRDTVFLVSLGSTTADEGFMARGYGVGINQVVWDVETNTLHVESDELLAQHTRFALYVTNGVRDANGDPVRASRAFRNFRQTVQGDYRDHLHDAMLMAGAYGFRERDVVAASVFTTQSATAVLEKMRDQIKAQTPEPADFLLGSKGERTAFALDQIASITARRQTGDNPPVFGNPANLNLALLRNIIPDVVGHVAFGKYFSPDYEVHPGEYIPQVETRIGVPAVQGTNEIYFNLVLPLGPKPPGGWPVAIYGHGNTFKKDSALLEVAATLASHGIATIAINAVGHGLGPLGTLTVNQTGGRTVTFPGGGRGLDQNGDRAIGATEGSLAAAPRAALYTRDGLRQTAADLMQLVRVIGVGVDVDGDGASDLDSSRTSYFGFSLGGMYGIQLLAVEPEVRVGVPNVPGGTWVEILRLGLTFRPGLGSQLASRTPSLLNAPGITELDGIPVGPPHFNENVPLRNRPPVVNTVAGATAIQQMLENSEWAFQSGNPGAYTPHLRRTPLPGMPAKSVIIQMAKGDQLVANPVTTAIIRSGMLADRLTFYRNDLAVLEDPAVLRSPHTFMTRIANSNLLMAAIARGAQEQIAAFLASGGTTVIHPEPARFFEVPIKGPLPEELNFIP